MSARVYDSSRPILQTRTLGTLWIVYGIIRLILAIWLVFFSTTATLMFGAVLNRVPDPFTLMDVFHFFYVVAIAWTALSGIFGIFAGMALRGDRAISRAWFLAAVFLALPDIPLGTMLGVYTLISSLSFAEIFQEKTARNEPVEEPRRVA
jgi:hypothetical protein